MNTSQETTCISRPLLFFFLSTLSSEPGCQHFHFFLTRRSKTILLEINCSDPRETWGTASDAPTRKGSLEDSFIVNDERPVSRSVDARVGVKPLWPAAASWKQFLCCGLISWMPADNNNFQSLPTWAALPSPRCFKKSSRSCHQMLGAEIRGWGETSHSYRHRKSSGGPPYQELAFFVHEQQNLI